MVYFLKERASQIQELAVILAEAEHLTRKMVIFNDIERSSILYFSFAMLSLFLKPFFAKSFLWVDGLRSILRSYARSELIAIASNNWQVKKLFFFRLLLVCSR